MTHIAPDYMMQKAFVSHWEEGYDKDFRGPALYRYILRLRVAGNDSRHRPVLLAGATVPYWAVVSPGLRPLAWSDIPDHALDL